MTNYKEILRLAALGIQKQDIAASCQCSRNTVRNVLNAAQERSITRAMARDCTNEALRQLLFPSSGGTSVYRMPDYEYVHREMQKSGVTLSLLWVEYCEQCRANGDIPYQSTQFNKYYSDFVQKTRATMHLDHKPGDTMQVDWAGQTAAVVDTDTGEIIPAYLFVAVLPYSGYAYTEAFLDMKQEAWINAHVHAYQYFGGVTRLLVPDNLKTGVIKNTKDETVINKIYREPAPSLKSIQSILKSGQDKLLSNDSEPEQAAPARRGFTRGADYYRRDQ